jgi:hypothetical protein
VEMQRHYSCDVHAWQDGTKRGTLSDRAALIALNLQTLPVNHPPSYINQKYQTAAGSC